MYDAVFPERQTLERTFRGRGPIQYCTCTLRKMELGDSNLVSRGRKIGKALPIESSRQTGAVYSASGVRYPADCKQALRRFLRRTCALAYRVPAFVCQAIERCR